MMRTLHLYGGLKQFSEVPLETDAADMRDVISAMKSWFPDFHAWLHENQEYYIVLSKKDKVEPRAVEPEFFNSPFEDIEEIHLFPEASGEEAFTIAAFAAWLGTSVAVATIIVNIAVSIVLGAVMQMLAPKPPSGNNAEKPSEIPSFLFNGPENVQEQGYQVPVVYGTHMTGSVIVSAGITIKQETVLATPVAAPVKPVLTVPGQWTGQPPTGGQEETDGGN